MKRYNLSVGEEVNKRVEKLAKKAGTTPTKWMKRYLALGILIDEKMEEDPPVVYLKKGEEIKGFVLL